MEFELRYKSVPKDRKPGEVGHFGWSNAKNDDENWDLM